MHGRPGWYSRDYDDEWNERLRACKTAVLHVNALHQLYLRFLLSFVQFRANATEWKSVCLARARPLRDRRAVISFCEREIQWNVSNFVCTVASLWYLLLAGLNANICSRETIRIKPLSSSTSLCSLILYLPRIRGEPRLYSAYMLAKDKRVIIE